MKDYIIDLKVYNTVPQEEIGIQVPLEYLHNGKLPIGIHQVVLTTTEELLEAFVEKPCHSGDIKILGVHGKENSK